MMMMCLFFDDKWIFPFCSKPRDRTRAAIDDMGGKLATMMTASTHNGVASRLVNAVLTCVSEAHELRGRDIFQTRAVSTGNGSQAAEKEEGHKRQKQERGKAKAR